VHRPGAVALSIILLAGAAGAFGDPAATLVPADVATHSEVRGDRLYLAAGVYQTNPPSRSLDEAAAEAESDQRFVLQLDGPLSPARRRALIDAGIQPAGYLPSNAVIARVAGGDAARLRELGFVRWHGAFDPAWKLEPTLGQRELRSPERRRLRERGLIESTITLFADASEEEVDRIVERIEGLPDGLVSMRSRFGGNPTIAAVVPLAEIGALAEQPQVQFIEDAAEATLRNASTQWIVQSGLTELTPLYDAGLRGDGQLIGVVDNGLDLAHCSFADPSSPVGSNHRKIQAYNTSITAGEHGSHVAGTAAGDSGLSGDLRGIAYKARLVFDRIPSSLNAASIGSTFTTHHNQGARVHTNSWGNDSSTAYDSLTRGIDIFTRDNEEDLVIFAVTNSFSVRNPENAKNSLAVAAHQDAPNEDLFCSGGLGPTSDGRRKPEITAPGCATMSVDAGTACGARSLTGTSMAAPAVAGVAALVRQYYMDGFHPSGSASPSDGFTPTGALLKATLLNATLDMTAITGFPGNAEGWGRLVADEALHFDGEQRTLWLEDVRHADGLVTNETFESEIIVRGSGERLRVTLAWMDEPAEVGAFFAAVNDIDLEVISPTGTVYRGNQFTSGVSQANASTWDNRNNVEQVLVPAPSAGAWTVRVIGRAVNVGRQGFAVVASADLSNSAAPLEVSIVSAPTATPPGEEARVVVELDAGGDTVIPGSETLRWRVDGGSFQSAPLTPFSGALYEGFTPISDCGEVVEVYATAESIESGEVRSPGGAPLELVRIDAGEASLLFEDTGETDLGWSLGVAGDTATTGIWERVTPIGTLAAPGEDCGDDGTMAFITGQGSVGGGLGENDIDGGATTLRSPALDLSGAVDAIVSYCRWYSNDQGAAPNTDVFLVQVAAGVGGPWTTVEEIGPSGEGTSGGWVERSFRVADHIALTSDVRVRFVASDTEPGSVVEAGVDEFRVTRILCEPVAASCPEDLSGDGQVNATDLALLLGDWTTNNVRSDITGDGIVGSADLGLILGSWGPCFVP